MQRPLADEIRPKTLDEVVGQRHLLAPGAVLRRLIESGTEANMVFYGPSGTGKTTIAHIGDDVLDVLEGGGGGVEAVEGLVGPFRHDVGDGGLAGAGGAIEHHVGLSPTLDQAAKHRAGGQQVPLANNLVQCFGAELIRQGALHGSPSFSFHETGL